MRDCGAPDSRELHQSSFENTNEHMRVFVASTDRKFQMELIRLSSMYAALHVFMIFWCKEKELSKVIPWFLSGLRNSIGMPLIFKVEGQA